MKQEIEKVLTMVEEGKMDANQATELIQLLKNREEEQVKKISTYTDKTLKIRVHSAENDNVHVNLPIKLVKVFLQAGHNIALNIPQSEKYVKDLDIGLIIDAIENELDGKIIEVVSADGDNVSVTIE